MQFRTETERTATGPAIEPGDTIFSIGSCFAENMAAKLSDGGFNVVSNPYGVLYNPASIETALDHLFSGREYTSEDLAQSGELWCSPFFHGSFSGRQPDKVLEGMNRAAEQGRHALQKATHVLISYGTPWVYRVSGRFAARCPQFPEGMVVANCHKFPADHYTRRRMEIDEIAAGVGRLVEGPLKGKNVILTVSPVRYLKDGLHGSNLGKSVLLLAAERICESHPCVHYFPAYEALTDDLRDYRFYGPDMAHPSSEAVDYIWELFSRDALSPEAAAQAVEVGRWTAATRHRVRDEGSAAHREFIDSMLRKADALRRKFPAADLSAGEEYFSQQHGPSGGTIR